MGQRAFNWMAAGSLGMAVVVPVVIRASLTSAGALVLGPWWVPWPYGPQALGWVALGAAVPFLILPVAWWRGAVRRRRVMLCQCVQCGYDLRASAGRCPECGVVIPPGTHLRAERRVPSAES